MTKSYNSIKAGWKNPKSEEVGKKKSYRDIKATEYDFGVDEDYINSFLKDSQEYTKNAQTDYSKMTFGNTNAYDSYQSVGSSLKERARDIRGFLNSRKNKIDAEQYNSLISYLDDFDKSHEIIVSSFSKANDFYSSFDTEYDYNSWIMNNTADLEDGLSNERIAARTTAYEANTARIKAIDDEIANMSEEEKWTKEYKAGGGGYLYEDWVETEAYQKLLDEKAKLEESNNQYKHTIYESDKAIAAYMSDEDYSATPQNLDYNAPTAEDIWIYKSDIGYAHEGTNYYGDGSNATGIGYDRNGNKVSYNVDDLVIEDPLGTYLKASYDDKVAAFSSTQNGNDIIYNYEETIRQGATGNWEYLRDEEKNYYYALLGNNQKDKAMSYLKDMEIELDRRANVQQIKDLEDASTLELVGHNIMSVPANILGGAYAFVGDVVDTVMGNEINPYAGGHQMQNYAQNTRGVTANKIDIATGNSGSSGFSWGDAYQAAMSGVDSLVGAVTFGGAYKFLAGMGAASAKVKELYEQGASNGQIAAASLFTGAAEMVFEKISIDHFLKNFIKAPTKNVWKLIGQTFAHGGIEMSEEAFTDIANTFTDVLTLGSRSDWEKLITEYKEQGYSDTDAITNAMWDIGGNVLESGIGGFISGVLMGGGGSAINLAQNNRAKNTAITKAGTDIVTNENVEQLAAIAETLDNTKANAKIKALAKELKGVDVSTLSEKAKTVFSKKVGNLHSAIAKAQGKSYTSAGNDAVKGIIREKLNENGITDEGTIAKASNIIIETIYGNKKLSESENKLMEEVGGKDIANYLLNNKKDVVAKVNITASQRLGQLAETSSLTENKNSKSRSINTDEYTFSDDGKTYVIGESNPVEITGIASIKNGKMTVELADGRTASLDDISLGSEAQAIIYEGVLEMGIDAASAQAIVNAFDYNNKNGISATTYIYGMQDAVRYGKIGGKAFLDTGVFTSELNPKQREMGYEIGRIAAENEAKKNAENVKGKIKANKKGKVSVGSVTYDGIKESDLNIRQKTTVKVLEQLFGNRGMNLVFFQSPVNYKGEHTGENGSFDPDTNTMRLDINAGIKGEDTILFTAAHELTHFIRVWSPEKFKAFADFLIDSYAKQGVSIDELVQRQIDKAKRNGREIDFDTAYEEVVADSCETFLRDSELLDRLIDLAKQDMTLFEKTQLYISDLLSDLRKCYNGLEPDSDEGKIVLKMTDTIEQLHRLWEDAALSALDNSQKAGGKTQKNTTEKGGVKQQAREYDADGVEYWQIESNKDIFKGIKSTKALKNAAYNYILHGDKGNKVVGLIDGQNLEFIRVSAKEYVYGVQSQSLSTEAYKQKMRMSTSIIDLIDNASIKYDAPDHKNHKLFPNGFKNYQGRVGIDETIFRYIVRVGKAKNGMIFYDINLEVDGKVPRANRTSLIKSSTSVSSISNSAKNVKDNVKKSNRDISVEKFSDRDNFTEEEYNRLISKKAIRTTKTDWAKVNTRRTQKYAHIEDDNIPMLDSIKLGEYNKINEAYEYIIRNDGKYGFSIISKRKINPEKSQVFKERKEKYENFNRPNASNENIGRTDRSSNKSSGYGRTVSRDAESFEKDEKSNSNSDSGKGTFDSGRGIKLSDRDIDAEKVNENSVKKSDRDYSYDALTSKADMEIKNLVNVSENEMSLYKADRNLFAKRMIEIAAAVGNSKNTNTSTYLYCKDLGQDIQITRNSIKHGAARIDSAYIAVCKSIADVLENSIVVNELQERGQTNGSYVLLGLAENKDSYVIIRSIVDKKTWKLEDYNELYAIRKKSIKKEDVGFKAPALPSKTGFGTSSTISISSFLKFVNSQKLANSVLPLDVVAALNSSREFDENVTPSLRYSDRDPEAITDRGLLADALVSVAKNDNEVKMLVNYKSNIELMYSQQERLDELNRQIKELSFAKGKRDTNKLQKLKDEAIKTANRINLYDKELLKLEATKPLRDLLKREKDIAIKKQKQKDAERYNKSKTAIYESREKRAAMTKLQRLVLDTSKWIANPSKADVKCPDILRAPYAEFLKSIDLSSRRLLKGGAPTQNDMRVDSAMDELAKVIQGIQEDQGKESSKLDAGYLDLPPEFVKQLQEMATDIKKLMTVEGEHIVYAMDSASIKKISQLVRTLNHAIKEMSRLYANHRFANVTQLGKDTMSYLDVLGVLAKTSSVKDFVLWENALPYYAFKRFGKGGESIFEEFMDAQDKLAFLADEIFKFQKRTWTDTEAKTWGEDTHTISLPSGKSLTLTSADAMSVYCLVRREQGRQHLLGGGVRVLGMKKNGGKAADSRSTLSNEDIDVIINSLTDRQIRVAKDIQEFMSTVCAEWGNEISMKRFLTKMFTERFYFPIESNKENMDQKDPKAQQSDLYRLLNISATKPTNEKANNEIVIRNIFDVFANHSSDMARLNAYGMAMLDVMKWFNYRERTKANDNGQFETYGVYKSIENAYGEKANRYVLTLIKDINGRYNDGGDHPFLMGMTRAAKTAMVGGNLRVAALQFTAYPRAAYVLSVKSLAYGINKLFKSVEGIDKAKKYCGIALWKSFGFYDTNISKSVEEQIKGAKSKRQKLIELSLKGAEWSDAITWGCLWNACEYEISKTSKNKIGSEEFNQEVGNKLREVIYSTQVVDSTLTRSQLMRNKSGLTQSATAFMPEPTLSANILMDAAFEFGLEKRRTGAAKLAWKKTGGKIGKAIAIYSVGQMVAALFEALFDAYRDDDDEEFNKKFSDAFVSNAITDIMPFNKLPFFSDVTDLALSLLGIGYFSSDSLYLSALTETKRTFDIWSEIISNGGASNTIYSAIYSTTKALSYLTGVSVSGVMREGVTLWNNTAGAVDPYLKVRTYESSSTDKNIAEYYFDNGDTASVKKSVNKMIKEKTDAGKTEKEAKSEVRTSFTTTYKSEYVDAAKAKDYVEMNRIRQFLYATGLYGTLSELDKTLQRWRTAE